MINARRPIQDRLLSGALLLRAVALALRDIPVDRARPLVDQLD